MFTETDVVTVRPARYILTYFKKKYIFLHRLMASSCNDIQLLLSCQINKFNRIPGNTDREVRILRFLRMFHRVFQLVETKHVHVEMMSALVKVSVENMNQVVLSLVLGMAECTRSDRLGVGDSVECVLIRKLCDGV